MMLLELKKYSYMGYFAVAVVILTVCRTVLSANLYERTGVLLPGLGVASDLLLLALIFYGSLLFRWRGWGYVIAATAGALVLFNVINIVLVCKFVSVFTNELFRIFVESEHDSGIGAFMGMWAHAPFVSVVLWFGFTVWGGERIQNTLNRAYALELPRRNMRRLALGFILLGLAANGTYYFYLGPRVKNSQADWAVRPTSSYWAEYFRGIRESGYWNRAERRKGMYPASFDIFDRAALACLGVGADGAKEAADPGLEPFDKIIIVAVESLDLQSLSAFNPRIPVEATCELNGLSDRYLSFHNYFTAAQPTSRGTHGMLCSRLDYSGDFNTDFETLFSVFERGGYRTRMLNGSIGSFELAERRYREMFKPETCLFYEDFAELYGQKSGAWGLSDYELFNDAFDLISRETDGKFVYYIATLDTHLPYRNSGPGKGEAERRYAGKFLQSLYCLDKNLGEFIRRIMNAPWYDARTLIVITADHSATHGENFLRRTSFDPDRIPLILISRDNVLAGYFDPERYSSQIDLAPTLVRLAHLERPASFMGSDLGKSSDGALIRLDRGIQYRSKDEDEIIDPDQAESVYGKLIGRYYRQFYPTEPGRRAPDQTSLESQ